MELKTKTNGRVLTVFLSGEIDEHRAAELRKTLDAIIDTTNYLSVVFDMSAVSFVDSTGLGLILGRYKKLRARGGELSVSGVSAQVDKVFKASGVYTVCPKIS